MGIKAIETRYNGYRFRSRLEARWAVFFDTLGITYEYEPEGYDLGEAGWYLPDFWLPEHKCWLEVKGVSLSISEAQKDSEYAKCKELARQAELQVYVAAGSIPKGLVVGVLNGVTYKSVDAARL
ncbi:MAG: hypothetical protein H0T57_13855 [Rubrobacter sp.]|jgi:hypothetical protein|nr:hypothetical protein [Rubrobacter sp.]MBA3614722.1 hypothetical protein [Rubrobacteraceae bacterium]